MYESAGLLRVRSGELLYTDEVGRDACGIGAVAAKDGKPSAEVVKKTLNASCSSWTANPAKSTLPAS
jgi:hypothetical protein